MRNVNSCLYLLQALIPLPTTPKMQSLHCSHLAEDAFQAPYELLGFRGRLSFGRRCPPRCLLPNLQDAQPHDQLYPQRWLALGCVFCSSSYPIQLVTYLIPLQAVSSPESPYSQHGWSQLEELCRRTMSPPVSLSLIGCWSSTRSSSSFSAPSSGSSRCNSGRTTK